MRDKPPTGRQAHVKISDQKARIRSVGHPLPRLLGVGMRQELVQETVSKSAKAEIVELKDYLDEKEDGQLLHRRLPPLEL